MLKWITSFAGLALLSLACLGTLYPQHKKPAVSQLVQMDEASASIEEAMLAAGPLHLAQSVNHTVRNTIINNASVNHTVRNTIINNASVNHTVRNTIINNASVNHTVRNTIINNVSVTHLVANGSVDKDGQESYALDLFSKARASLVSTVQRFFAINSPVSEADLPLAERIKVSG